MKRFEPVLEAEQPEAVLVVGDVNSTIGCALVTSKFVLDSGRFAPGSTARSSSGGGRS